MTVYYRTVATVQYMYYMGLNGWPPKPLLKKRIVTAVRVYVAHLLADYVDIFSKLRVRGKDGSMLPVEART
jgi:hypothetical protein